jgi:hypothetical protein
MKYFVIILFAILLAVTAYPQSRRAPGQTAKSAAETANDQTIKEMFDEANEYNRVKFAEYQQKKVPYSESLRIKTDKERKALAAKYATIAGTRKTDDPEDIYYTGENER